MQTKLARAEQLLTRAWTNAQLIEEGVDENLKSCLINLSSGLQSMVSALNEEQAQIQNQPRVHPGQNAIRTRSGIRFQFEDNA